MSQAPKSQSVASPLGKIRMRLMSGVAIRGVLVLPLACISIIVALVAADALADLSEQTRAGVPWILEACAGIVIGSVAVQLRGFVPERVARLYERLFPKLGTRLSNAVQLAGKPGETAVQEFLRLEALDLARRASDDLKAWPVLKRGTLAMLAVLTLPAAVCAVLLIITCGPDVLQAERPRFLDPHGDHPPFNRLRIEVNPKTASVLYGGELEIRATASGRPVDKLWLVTRAGGKETRTIMFLAPDRSFFQSLSNLREPAEYYVTDGAARSFRYPLKIRTTPQITMVEVSNEYPEYTSKASRKTKLTEEIQALPAETKISFRVTSNRPLKSGELAVTPVLGGKATKIALTNDAMNIVTGSFVLTEPVVFAISVCDTDGLQSAESKQGRFNVLPDERPRIFVLEPGRDAVATPSIRIPVRVQAEDDYAVSRVVWLRGHNRSIEQAFTMKLTLRDGARSVESSGAFDLEKLGVRPGDLIEYYFEAADNYPKGPNLTVSKLYRLEIISKEQYEAYLRQAAARKSLFEPYMALSHWFKRLAERSRDLDNKLKNGTDAEKKAAEQEAAALAQDLEKYHEQLSKLLSQAVMFDVERSFRETLVQEESQIGQLARDLKAATGSGGVNSDKMSEISRKMSELAKSGEEEVGEPAEQIASVAKLLAKADVFVRLAAEQGRVAQLLRRLGEKTDGLSRVEQMEVQELAHQQRRIQTELGDWLSSLPELLNQLPPDAAYDPLRKQVNEFVKAVSDAQIEPDIASALSSLAEMEASAGYVMAKSAAEKMDKLVAKCDPLLGEGKAALCMKFQPTKIGQTLEQILAAMGVSGRGGQGQSERNGYSMFNSDVAIYGPNMELSGEQAGGRGDRGGSNARRVERVGSDPGDSAPKTVQAQGHVRLQTDAKFPLRYRDVVGDYFRAIAESEEK